MAALGRDVQLGAEAVDRFQRGQDRTGRLDRKARPPSGCPVLIPPKTPPAWLAEKRDLAVRPSASRLHCLRREPAAAAKPSPISTPLTALMPISAAGEIGVQLAVDRRAQPGRHAVRYDFDDRSDARPGLCAPPTRSSSHIAAAVCAIRRRRTGSDRSAPNPNATRSMRSRPDLHQRAADPDLRTQHQPRHRTGRHPAGRLARRTAPHRRDSRAMPYLSSYVRSAWPGLKLLRDGAVILAPLIHVLNLERDRRSRRPPFEHAREDANRVRLLPLRREARLTRPPTVQPGLDVGSRRASAAADIHRPRSRSPGRGFPPRW